MRKLFKTMTMLLVLIPFLALPAIGLAEEYTAIEEVKKEEKEKKKAIKLEEVVVTATRTEKDMDSAPGSVTIISKEDMKFRDIHTIDDALKFEGGIYKGKVRGMPNIRHTLIMVNGMPLNTGWFGHVRWDNIATENVERIEVIRGPSSALYGGNAMGGVINIITSAPKKFEAEGQAGYGSDDTVRYSFHVGDRFMDKLSLRLGYESEETDGYPTGLVQRSISSAGSGTLTGGYEMLSKSGQRKWVIGDKGDYYNERWNVNLNAVYDLTDTGSLAFDFQMGRKEFGYDRPHTYLQDASGNQAFSGSVDVGNGETVKVSPSKYITSGIRVIKTPSYMLTYRESFGSVSFTGKVGYQNEKYWSTTPIAKKFDNYDNAPGYVKEFDTDTVFSDLQTNIPVGDSHLLTCGFYFRFDDFDQERFELAYYRDEHSKTTPKTEMTQGKDRFYAVYIQDEWQLMDKLTLFTGARFDYWDAFDGKSGAVGNEEEYDSRNDSAISPKMSVVWKPVVNTIIKGSVGKAFRPPTLYELFRTYQGSRGMVYSNPDIEPETLWNYEIGVDQYFFDRGLKLSATCFHTDIDDLIYSYKIVDDSYRDNTGEARINGIELGAFASPFDWLNLWGNYTYNDSKIKKNDHDPKMEGKKITGMPVRTINIGTEISYKWITASLMGQYLGRIYKQKYNDDIDDVYGAETRCWLWETRLTVSPWEHTEVSFSVDNLFDKEYFDGSVGRERNYFVEMRLKW